MCYVAQSGATDYFPEGARSIDNINMPRRAASINTLAYLVDISTKSVDISTKSAALHWVGCLSFKQTCFKSLDFFFNFSFVKCKPAGRIPYLQLLFAGYHRTLIRAVSWAVLLFLLLILLLLLVLSQVLIRAVLLHCFLILCVFSLTLRFSTLRFCLLQWVSVQQEGNGLSYEDITYMGTLP